ncbi:helix-turn-helix domain-containing protein [Sphaerotilus mobilis]|uniref:AraC family transcriptional regulator n=1 Tax=Sphaerotilus mobilis TaxID=47994 RepID=A0A4Q7L9B6_9BURK|nr:AraC family transcriptional regulator [Sphaerotilus mobilis]RZS46685.1 AraC family transcriptional regulator [Sphaerotilus mobilis]
MADPAEQHHDLGLAAICDPADVARHASGEPEFELPDGWAGLPLAVFPIPTDSQRGPAHVNVPLVLMALRGRGRRWYRFGARTVELSTQPGMFELYGRDFQRSGARWLGEPGKTVGVHLSPEMVRTLAPATASFDLRTTHEVFDPKLQWLMQELLEEAERGAPGGALYAQGLSCSLLGRLASHYGAPIEVTPAGQLGRAHRQRIIEHIHDHLGDDLSIVALAREVDLSPHHFAQCFKASMGMTPHRYVLQQRLARARTLLKTTSMPIAEMALALGFSSQSHFTQVFRAHGGITPAVARKT